MVIAFTILLGSQLGASGLDQEFADLLALPTLGEWPAAGQSEGLALILDVGARLGVTARGREPETSLWVNAETGMWDTWSLLRPRKSTGYGSLGVYVGGELEATDWLALHAFVDSGEVRVGATLDPPVDGIAADGRPIIDQLGSGAFIREIGLLLGPRGFTLALGRRRSRVADGLVYDDFGTGASLTADFGQLKLAPLSVGASAHVVGNSWDDFESPSLLFSMSVEYQVSFLENVSVFGALFLDRGGALRDVLTSAAAEAVTTNQGPAARQERLDNLFDPDRQSHGHVGYFGASTVLLSAVGLSVRAAAVGSAGSVDVEIDDSRNQRFQLWGWAGQAELHYGLTGAVDLGLFAFGLSGDQPPRVRDNEPAYGGFVGIAPYWVWTSIFFSGGLNQGFFAGRTTAAGINGHGVVGFGPSLELAKGDLRLDWRIAYLRAMAPPPPAPLGGPGMSYGVELDVLGKWETTEWLSLALETDILVPGAYFPRRRVAYQLIGLVDVHLAL